MKFMTMAPVAAFIGLQLWFNVAAGITPSAKALVEFETQANAAAQRSQEPIPMPHYDIPVEMLDMSILESADKKFSEYLMFMKDGKKYVRWIINPEDTKWHEEVKTYFAEKGIQLEKKFYFTGYQTASRSYIIESPDKKFQISVKSSTNVAGGQWADKKQPVNEAKDSLANTAYLQSIQKISKFKYFDFLPEPAIFKLPNLDQAVVFRELGEINSLHSDKIYIPGFTALHSAEGQRIARLNKSFEPYEFWSENYIIPVSKALGEFAARTGFQFDSPHSQNFLVELDKNFKPTGKIIFRDLADLYVTRNIVKKLHNSPKTYFRNYGQTENVLGTLIHGGFGPLHGNKSPEWVTSYHYLLWAKIFHNIFIKTYLEESGLSREDIKVHRKGVNGSYFNVDLEVDRKSPRAQDYFKNLIRFKNPVGQVNCSKIFYYY